MNFVRPPLQRTNQLSRKQPGFLGKILCANPVAALTGIARLGDETANLLDQVALRSAQLLASSLVEIPLRDGDVVISITLIRGLISGRNLW